MKFKAVSSPDELNFLSLQWTVYFLSSAGLLVLLSFFISPLFYKFFLLTGALICFLIIFLFAIEVFEKKEIKKLGKEKEIELTSSIRHSFNGPGNSNIELSIKEASKNFPIEFIYYKNEKVLSKALSNLDREELRLLKIKKINLKYFTENGYFLYYKYTGTEITKITADIYLDDQNSGQILKNLGFTIDDEAYTGEYKELRNLYSYPDKSIKIKS